MMVTYVGILNFVITQINNDRERQQTVEKQCGKTFMYKKTERQHPYV